MKAKPTYNTTHTVPSAARCLSMSSTAKTFGLFAVLAASVSFFGDVSMAAPVWEGSSNTDWNDANNWTPAGVPTMADIVSFSAAFTNPPTVTAPSPTIAGLNLNYAATPPVISIENLRKLTVTGTTSVQEDATVTGDGFFHPTDLSIAALKNFTISTIEAVTVSGTLSGEGTITGNLTIGGTHSPGTSSTATQTVTGTLTYDSGSIFSWDISQLGGGLGVYDKVVATATGTGGAFFNINNSDFTTAFWDTNKTWTDIFTGGAFGTVFSGGFGGSVPVTGIVSDQGSFAVSGSNLTFTAVPEPTSALAGLLLVGGLLRRRRN
jgi:hypothetical protein